MKVMNRLLEIADDEAAVKLMFDHVRNLTLCALMLGAAEYLRLHPDVSMLGFETLVASVSMWITAGFLIMVNYLHAARKALKLTSAVERFAVLAALNLIGPWTILAVLLSRTPG